MLSHRIPILSLCLFAGLFAARSVGAEAASAPEPPPDAYAAFCMGIHLSEDGRYAEAIQWLEKALELDPASAACHIWIGAICDERLSRPAKAKSHFQRALELAPESFEARYGLARQLLRENQLDKAREQLLIATETPEARRNPELAAKAYAELATRLELDGQWSEAAQYYEQAANASTSPAYLLLRLGRLYRAMARNELAAETFLKLTRLVPTYAPVYRDLCNTYKTLGRWADALAQLEIYMGHHNCPEDRDELLREAAELASRARRSEAARRFNEELLGNQLDKYDPDSPDPRMANEIASTLIRLGQHNRSEPFLKDAIESSPDTARPALRLKLANVYEKLGRIDDAAKQLREASRTSEPRAAARYLTRLAGILESAGRYADAERILKEILGLPGAKAAGHAELALFYGRRSQGEKGIENLLQAIQLADTQDSIRYRIHLSILYTKTNREKEAEQVLIEAHRMFPEDPAINNALGWFYAERGIRLDDALTLIQKALQANPENPYYLDSLGWVYFKQGLKEQALEQLLRAAALAEDSIIFDHLGDVYLELGQPEKARAQWQRSLDLDPDIKGVREKLRRLGHTD